MPSHERDRARRTSAKSPSAKRLKTYRQKRDFTTSPEPTGDSRRRAPKERFFCVQKHLASHLHYDFRLEHRGVLLSWAVPKGPVPDPAVKRLAMQVEDHPIDYGTFEGVIPSGYGAGIVVLWDRGIWRPLVEDVDAALRRGNLPFVVLGEKVQGAWTLVRSGRMGKNSWLLIKQRDEWATGQNLAEERPESVASGADFAEVLAQSENPWTDVAPVKSGETGALFRAIIASADKLRESRERPRATRRKQRVPDTFS
jgi:bifunctional non-homologous end joining protein LigD